MSRVFFEKMRKQLGLTQAELSKVEKIPRPLYGCFENGEWPLNKKYGERLYHFLEEHGDKELEVALGQILKQGNAI